MNKIKIIPLFLAAGMILSGCGKSNSDSSSEIISSEIISTENKTAPTQHIEVSGNPVLADDLNDGIYNINVDSSSSMFNITKCSLEVSDGKMTALMTMHGKGYLYLFMGRGENASDESQYIPFKEDNDGMHTFTVPVEALDISVDCSAFSKNKEEWYDRQLVFRSDSLPVEAFKNIVTAETLDLKDGEYTVDVSIEGGSGKAKIQSPARLTIENGKAFADIIWGSSNYDYMIVNSQKFENINTNGNSEFKIPVEAFNRKISVLADTTAMSQPHEIEYLFYFDSESIKR